MTTAKAPAEYCSGWCSTGGHERCRGAYAGCTCCCDCHRQSEPEPEPARLLAVGARVICAPGTVWASEDLTGAVLEVLEVHDYPPEIGGPVFVCRWPGTTTSPAYGAVLGRDKIEGVE